MGTGRLFLRGGGPLSEAMWGRTKGTLGSWRTTRWTPTTTTTSASGRAEGSAGAGPTRPGLPDHPASSDRGGERRRGGGPGAGQGRPTLQLKQIPAPGDLTAGFAATGRGHRRTVKISAHRTRPGRSVAVVLLALLLAVVPLAIAPAAALTSSAGGADSSAHTEAAAWPTAAQADPTPTPTPVNEPGDRDADGQDSGGVPLLLIILVGIVAIVVGSFLAFRRRAGSRASKRPELRPSNEFREALRGLPQVLNSLEGDV